ncbi:hypothetical protein LY13_004795 [Prauserella aidingensis]|nr:hypothetical protein [Prauserella aidingensis]
MTQTHARRDSPTTPSAFTATRQSSSTTGRRHSHQRGHKHVQTTGATSRDGQQFVHYLTVTNLDHQGVDDRVGDSEIVSLETLAP